MARLSEYLHRVKDIPSLEELLKDNKKGKPQSQSNQLNIIKSLNAAFGGTVIE